MTDESQTPGVQLPATQAQARALTAERKVRLITESSSAMFDSAAFEHLQRVAAVLAASGLVPKSLTHVGSGDNAQQLPDAVVIARCTLLADQAQRSGADVVAYIQSTSIINGRLMHEGKLVNAIVKQRIGAELRYRFGLWDTDHIVFPPVVQATDANGEPMFGPDGEPVMVPDDSFLHGAGERLAVRVFDKNHPEDYVDGSVGQWKATRKDSPWSMPANWPRQLRYRGAREWARAYDPGAMLGMLADGDEDLPEYRDEPRSSGVMGRLSGGQNGAGFDHGQIIEQVGAEKPRRGRKPNPPEMKEPIGTDLGAEDADGVAQAMNATLAGDDLPDGLKEVAGNVPGETESVPAAEASPDSSASATDASSASAAETSSPADTSAASESGASDAEPEVIEAEGVEEQAADDLPPDLSAYIDKVEAARDFTTVKGALRDLMATEFWKGIANDQANRIRRNTWETMVEFFAPEALPNPAKDASAFRLWIEAQDDPEAIDDMRNKLESDPDFAGKQVAFKEQIRGATQARIHALEP
ncbi:MAG TPA: hypothetical protein VJP88_05220 [Caulobacteraceae bacterium]|nr:hypothetical protein [Caulobacteraceae bacterium]